jgi:SAM-dependent methyltransferase
MFDESDVSHLLDRVILPFGDHNEAVMNYHRIFVRRYANTLSCLASLPRDLKTLELGANPYGLTAIIRHRLFSDLQLASFGETGEVTDVLLGICGQQYRLRETKFNAERDRWPYPDETFDLILSCEMLEHLVMDPMHLFAEANRVLKPDGRLFVSTPNASSFQNVIKALCFQAQSLAPHYRAPMDFSGIYQRHNRELTPPALQAMFKAGGFGEQTMFTFDSYPFNSYGVDDSKISRLREIFGDRLRGDTLNCLGLKRGAVADRYPEDEELYLKSDFPSCGPLSVPANQELIRCPPCRSGAIRESE